MQAAAAASGTVATHECILPCAAGRQRGGGCSQRVQLEGEWRKVLAVLAFTGCCCVSCDAACAAQGDLARCKRGCRCACFEQPANPSARTQTLTQSRIHLILLLLKGLTPSMHTVLQTCRPSSTPCVVYLFHLCCTGPGQPPGPQAAGRASRPRLGAGRRRGQRRGGGLRGREGLC